MSKIKEPQIEQKFINKLIELKYAYREDIRTQDSLDKNFRKHFEELNGVTLEDSEFNRLKDEIIQADVFKSSEILRQRSSFIRDDKTPLYYTLLNIDDWCKNSFEVINQLRINSKESYHRYDVILLINGLPLVQIELKTLETSPKKAIEQIVRYKNDLENGYKNTLLSFMQLFIVSNESNTMYFTNNNEKHFTFNAEERFLPIYTFADINHKKIKNLYDFSDAFLQKCTLAQMISRYIVLVKTESKLLIMRPYQINAVKNIIECIKTNCGNGYIWHTTGSGKTLTSFKASTLLKDNPNIYKCLFVVDRKDLDRQTREEFNKFQENCVEENTNTHTLVKRILSDDYEDKIIVTTIQKLSYALKKRYKDNLESIKNKKMIFIFDECHRSQFGDNHKAIKEFFPNSQFFGFTGTPIFEKNSYYSKIKGEEKTKKVTTDIFESLLEPSYTISDAIADQNVLRFHVEYYKPENNLKKDEKISKSSIAKAITNKHNQATSNRRFNAIFTTSSINDAIEYYELFKQLNQESETHLNIACVFSPPADGNEDVKQLQEDLLQEKEDNRYEPEKKKEALTNIINDYNQHYKTNHNIQNFDMYYQDVQQRIKDQRFTNDEYPHVNKIDITIVVDMLLTGFDSKYLNTLYVDKDLKHHGLIQAFSRTNRVLNETKPFGLIVDFRGLESQVDEAIKMFSDPNKEKDPVKIWFVEPSNEVIGKFESAVKKLEEFMSSHGLKNLPQEVYNLKGDNAKVEFIKNFKEIQKLKVQLDQYTDLSEEDKTNIENIILQDTFRSFKSSYMYTASELKEYKPKEDEDAIVHEIDFEYVLFNDAMIDYDYIMKLLSENTKPTIKIKQTKEQIIQLISSDSKFQEQKDDLISFIEAFEFKKEYDLQQIKKDFQDFTLNKTKKELELLAHKFELDNKALSDFVSVTMARYIFDAEMLSELFTHQGLDWIEQDDKELQMMKELKPLLLKLAKDKEISGLEFYE